MPTIAGVGARWVLVLGWPTAGRLAMEPPSLLHCGMAAWEAEMSSQNGVDGRGNPSLYFRNGVSLKIPGDKHRLPKRSTAAQAQVSLATSALPMQYGKAYPLPGRIRLGSSLGGISSRLPMGSAMRTLFKGRCGSLPMPVPPPSSLLPYWPKSMGSLLIY